MIMYCRFEHLLHQGAQLFEEIKIYYLHGFSEKKKVLLKYLLKSPVGSLAAGEHYSILSIRKSNTGQNFPYIIFATTL